MKTKTIHLPATVKEGKAYSALAVLMHEAGHLRYSQKIPKELCKTNIDKMLLNAIEDIRIDNKNFDLLPNIQSFYKELYQDALATLTPERKQQIPLMQRSLNDAILENEGFYDLITYDSEVSRLHSKHNVSNIVFQGTQQIDSKDWKGMRETIDKLKAIYQIKPEDEKPLPEEEESKGIPAEGGIMGEKDMMAVFGKEPGEGSNNTGESITLDPLALQDITKNTFKELLNIKLTKKIEDGIQLDTDNLTAFFVGDLEELFSDTTIVKTKKSKISFVLDASGSMNSQLCDNTSCRETLVACVESLTRILDEVNVTEGLNVDYSLAGFTSSYHPFTKENWKREYMRLDGGTRILPTFKAAQEDLLTDYELEGKKIIIIFTDGAISTDEIDTMKKLILQHNSDVRCLIIGVGCEIGSHFVKEVVGEHNITTRALADVILMDAIMQLVD